MKSFRDRIPVERPHCPNDLNKIDKEEPWVEAVTCDEAVTFDSQPQAGVHISSLFLSKLSKFQITNMLAASTFLLHCSNLIVLYEYHETILTTNE